MVVTNSWGVPLTLLWVLLRLRMILKRRCPWHLSVSHARGKSIYLFNVVDTTVPYLPVSAVLSVLLLPSTTVSLSRGGNRHVVVCTSVYIPPDYPFHACSTLRHMRCVVLPITTCSNGGAVFQFLTIHWPQLLRQSMMNEWTQSVPNFTSCGIIFGSLICRRFILYHYLRRRN